MRRLGALGFLVATALAGWFWLPALAAREEVYVLAFDYGVVQVCGLGTPAMEDGYRRLDDRAAARARLDDDRLREIRIEALGAANRAWSDRGIGGSHAWCATQGPVSAARFAP